MQVLGRDTDMLACTSYLYMQSGSEERETKLISGAYSWENCGGFSSLGVYDGILSSTKHRSERSRLCSFVDVSAMKTNARESGLVRPRLSPHGKVNLRPDISSAAGRAHLAEALAALHVYSKLYVGAENMDSSSREMSEMPPGLGGLSWHHTSTR